MEYQTSRVIKLFPKNLKHYLFILFVFISQTTKPDDVDKLISSLSFKNDNVENLIITILNSSKTERSKVQHYISANIIATKKSNKKIKLPIIDIPDNKRYEVNSKFPKDYIGIYVYGNVHVRHINQCDHYEEQCPDVPGQVVFWADNQRTFVFETKDESLIKTFALHENKTYFIPKDYPLKIVQKCLFNYIVVLPCDELLL